MNLQAMRASMRVQVDDAVAPYHTADPTLTEFANEAQEEACRRARLLTDSSTAQICTVNVTAGTAIFTLDPRVLFVRRIRIVGQSRPLQKTPMADLDQLGTEWQDETGEVMGWVPDYESRKVRLFRIPTEDIVLQLTVVRMPLAEMAAPTDSPEIPLQMHRQLVHWMRYRFYLQPDADMNDPKKAADALAAFEQQFGGPSTALDEQWIHEKHGFDEYEGLR